MNYTEQDIPRMSAKQWHDRPMVYRHVVDASCSCGKSVDAHDLEVWCRRASTLRQVPDWNAWSRTGGTVPDYTRDPTNYRQEPIT